MKLLRKYPIIITGAAAAVIVGVVGLVAARPAQASGGWGLGMAYGPSVVASCDSYNLLPMRVDVPQGKYAGYVTGRLSNLRTGAIRKPAFGPDTVYNVGSPTVGYLIFNPPEGSQDGDTFHATVTLYDSPALANAVGSFEFSYKCATGEVVHDVSYAGDPINTGYSDNLVVLAQGKDSLGNPQVEAWCLDPQGYASTIGLTLSKKTLASFPAYPATNTLIDKNNNCLVPVAAYVLTTGEYQVTIGPDPYGVISQIIFTGLTPSNLKFVKYNQNQQ